MKKYVVIAWASLALLSCNGQYGTAMKSADKNFILETANQYYAKKKWSKAIALYDRLPNLVAGTEDAPEVLFKSAYANYYDKNYKLAGHQFRNFSTAFSQDARREEAAYMSAICYYQDSADYNLDQGSTEDAINSLQDFLNNFPDSERTKDINEKIEKLTFKLEYKAYEQARNYFKIADYRAAVVAFENVLEDYPSTKLKPQIFDYIMKSRYELGMHSIYDLKKERLESAIAFSKEYEKTFPDSAKEIVHMRDKLSRELEKHLEHIKEVEARKAEYLEKQKEHEQKQKHKEETK